MVCEFWKTFSTEKSETICKYINKKKEIKEEISKPVTLIETNFKFIFFLVEKNWEIAKSNDNQSERFPRDGVIS